MGRCVLSVSYLSVYRPILVIKQFGPKRMLIVLFWGGWRDRWDIFKQSQVIKHLRTCNEVSERQIRLRVFTLSFS
jgi:hypothetical protein